jgi:Flp pilus assembly protein TadG
MTFHKAVFSFLRFRADTRANVAVIFAISIMPILGGVGCAVDYSMAVRLRSKMQSAADAASVGSIGKNSAAYIAAGSQGDGTISVGGPDAVKIFNANMTGETGFTLNSVTATTVKSNSTITSTVQFSGTMQTTFMKVMGSPSMTLTGTSASTVTMPVFIDFYLLLDNSPSMGVAATPADVATMVNNTPDQCAFACHDTNDNNNYYKLAKTLNVTTRIDVVRSAAQSLMDTAAATETYTDQFRMAIYTFGSSASTIGLSTIAPLTANLSTAKTQAGNIDLMTVAGQNQNNDQHTNFTALLPQMNALIPTPGPGTSNSPKKYLFLSQTALPMNTIQRASSRQPAEDASHLSIRHCVQQSRRAGSRLPCFTRPTSHYRPTVGTTSGSRRLTPDLMAHQ